MTGRNDSILYSGITSVSGTRQQEIRERKDKAIEKRAQLKPGAEIVMEEIQKLIDALSRTDPKEVQDLIKNGKPGALEIDMLGKAVAVEHLTILKTRLDNMLRDNKS